MISIDSAFTAKSFNVIISSWKPHEKYQRDSFTNLVNVKRSTQQSSVVEKEFLLSSHYGLFLVSFHQHQYACGQTSTCSLTFDISSVLSWPVIKYIDNTVRLSKAISGLEIWLSRYRSMEQSLKMWAPWMSQGWPTHGYDWESQATISVAGCWIISFVTNISAQATFSLNFLTWCCFFPWASTEDLEKVSI